MSTPHPYYEIQPQTPEAYRGTPPPRRFKHSSRRSRLPALSPASAANSQKPRYRASEDWDRPDYNLRPSRPLTDWESASVNRREQPWPPPSEFFHHHTPSTFLGGVYNRNHPAYSPNNRTKRIVRSKEHKNLPLPVPPLEIHQPPSLGAGRNWEPPIPQLQTPHPSPGWYYTHVFPLPVHFPALPALPGNPNSQPEWSQEPAPHPAARGITEWQETSMDPGNHETFHGQTQLAFAHASGTQAVDTAAQGPNPHAPGVHVPERGSIVINRPQAVYISTPAAMSAATLTAESAPIPQDAPMVTLAGSVPPLFPASTPRGTTSTTSPPSIPSITVVYPTPPSGFSQVSPRGDATGARLTRPRPRQRHSSNPELHGEIPATQSTISAPPRLRVPLTPPEPAHDFTALCPSLQPHHVMSYPSIPSYSSLTQSAYVSPCPVRQPAPYALMTTTPWTEWPPGPSSMSGRYCTPLIHPFLAAVDPQRSGLRTKWDLLDNPYEPGALKRLSPTDRMVNVTRDNWSADVSYPPSREVEIHFPSIGNLIQPLHIDRVPDATFINLGHVLTAVHKYLCGRDSEVSWDALQALTLVEQKNVMENWQIRVDLHYSRWDAASRNQLKRIDLLQGLCSTKITGVHYTWYSEPAEKLVMLLHTTESA